MQNTLYFLDPDALDSVHYFFELLCKCFFHLDHKSIVYCAYHFFFFVPIHFILYSSRGFLQTKRLWRRQVLFFHKVNFNITCSRLCVRILKYCVLQWWINCSLVYQTFSWLFFTVYSYLHSMANCRNSTKALNR